jgi:hypothetical protein
MVQMDGQLRKPIPILLRIIGAALTVVGLVGAFYGSLEIFFFHLFSTGGKFYYDGFGMGSLWFMLLAAMNLGYYLVAAVCLPLGIGYMRLRSWTLPLAQLTLWFWLGAGIWLAGTGVSLLPSLFRLDLPRDVLWMRLVITAVFLLIFLLLLPVLLLRFYKSSLVRAAFEARHPKLCWT